MRIIAFDTSQACCSLAIIEDDEPLWSQVLPMARGHAEALPKMAKEALSSTKTTIEMVDRIAVTTGPGTFAGVRIGIAFARGLALGTGVDVLGISSLQALAASVERHNDTSIAVAVDARRNQVYAALFSGTLNSIVPPFSASPENARKAILAASGERNLVTIGSGAPILGISTDRQLSQLCIDPIAVATLARSQHADGGTAKPTYLRPPDARPSNTFRSKIDD